MTYEEFSSLFRKLREDYGTPVQAEGEFWALVNLVQSRGYSRILEIGVEKAGTIIFWDRIAGPEGRVVGADISLSRIEMDIDPQSEFSLVEGDTHAPEIIEEIKQKIPKVDFLFIDGDHRYEGVRLDWENFRPLVREGGLVAFHDIVDKGVGPFWLEIESTHKTERFHLQSGGIGIGVVYL